MNLYKTITTLYDSAHESQSFQKNIMKLFLKTGYFILNLKNFIKFNLYQKFFDLL